MREYPRYEKVGLDWGALWAIEDAGSRDVRGFVSSVGIRSASCHCNVWRGGVGDAMGVFAESGVVEFETL